MLHQDSGTTPTTDETYRTFVAEVARRQLATWLEQQTGPIADVTPDTPSAQVTRDPVIGLRHDLHEQPPAAAAGIRGDDTLLDCLRAESVGAIVAEQGALVDCLVMEETLHRAALALRPGGGLLLCVESVAHGMASLAAAGRWAELADAPQADVVLVGDYDAGVRRCFSPTEITECILGAGLVLDWVRPRTVLAATTVARAVETDPSALPTLINAELRMAVEHTGEATGRHLLVSAHRPG